MGDRPFKTLMEAQIADIEELVDKTLQGAVTPDAFANAVARWMVSNAAPSVDTLTTTPTSRAKARKTNGAKRTRKRPVLAPANIPEA